MTYLNRETDSYIEYKTDDSNYVIIYYYPDGFNLEFAHFFDPTSYYNFEIPLEELDHLIEMLQEVKEKAKELSGKY